MPDFFLSNIIYILTLSVIALLAILISVFVSKLRFKTKIFTALHFVLYEMSFINEDVQNKEGGVDAQKNIKELISKMEQFLSGMAALKGEKSGIFRKKNPYFALELAVKHAGEEVIFYSAVPKNEARLFEKQFESLFPGSSLILQENDYNIFNKNGVSAASYAVLKDSPVLPIKTYQDLDSDPLEVILNSFSKLKKQGEGAAFQLIIKPADNYFKKRVKIALSALRDGASLRDAKRIRPSFFARIFGDELEIPNFARDITAQSDAKEKPPVKVSEDAIKILEKKAAREMLAVNFRLVASAENKEDAEQVLKELESAFYQFNDPQANKFSFSFLKNASLRNLNRDFSFRLFQNSQRIYLNTMELASVYHFPVKSSSAPHLKVLKSKSAPAPFDLPNEGVLLGINSFRGKDIEVRMETNDRRRHLYIIGQTGTGKSGLMEQMVAQDVKNKAGLCVIDPHGSLVDSILSKIPDDRIDDVIYFDPASIKRPMGLNMMEYDLEHPEQKTFIANEVYDIFRKLWKDIPEAFGPMFEQYYRNSILLVMEDPSSGNTLLEVIRVLSDKNFRELKLSRTDNPILKAFWRDIAEKAGGDSALSNIVPYITSKYDTFLNNEIMRPILVQEKSSFNFRDIMDNGKILLVNLSKGRLGDLNAYLVGLIFVGKILMAALSRVDISDEENRRDFFLYLDEFQNITTKSIATILSEARKYRLNLTIAHQFIGQLEEEIKKAVFGNVGSMAVFRIGVEDSEFLEKQFLPVFNKQDLINIDNLNAYVKLLVKGQTVKPFNIKLASLQKGNLEKISALKELSALKYGRPREEVEEEIRKKYHFKI